MCLFLIRFVNRSAEKRQTHADAAAFVGNFQRMVRIADGTGIQLDEIAEVPSRAFRGRMGIDEFASAQGRGSH